MGKDNFQLQKQIQRKCWMTEFHMKACRGACYKKFNQEIISPDTYIFMRVVFGI